MFSSLSQSRGCAQREAGSSRLRVGRHGQTTGGGAAGECGRGGVVVVCVCGGGGCPASWLLLEADWL